MANNPPSGGNNQPQDDALAALNGMQAAAPADGADASHEPVVPDNANSPSSTGLVGMLSQGQLNAPSPDLGGSSRSFASGIPIGIPQPKAAGSAGPATKRPGKFDKIGVAREITLPANGADVLSASREASQAPARPVRRIAKPPAWWGAAIPVMYTVSSLLILISFWAVGGVFSIMLVKSGWPGVDFDPDAVVGDRMSANPMALVMLLCVPVSIAIGIMAIILSRKIKAYEYKMAAQAEVKN